MRALLCGSFDAAERDDWLQALRQAVPEVGWCLEPDPEVEVAVVANPPPHQLQGLPRLRLIQSLWAGVDRLLADPTLPPDVPIARMVDPAMSAAMAQTALWSVLSLHRGFFRYAEQQRSALWQPLPQRRADEVAVLVLGLGEMGRRTALALQAQGYAVRAWRHSGGAHAEPFEVGSGPAALAPLLGRSDIVLNLLPLTPATRGLLDQAFFAALRPGAALVNLARGAHVVDDDLLAALDAQQVGHAVLDVFHTEPLPPEHRYWRHPRVTVLPHAAALTDPRSAAQVVACNLRALRGGEPLQHLVQRERGY
ncbi:2-hydroxyacid dehydrogenase [Ideonella sp. BN130291]|uniref:2-hydroxyacid dehydrogenase n=1 Tax=Ideonella sp. BN130291 TaxID=3112940 RepID=UPI002E25C0F6|nr:glyoxylate/hydroxypyruvate reductase A [Ideonella sp. BN130291]